jgi:hypothetical protein
MHSHNWRTSVKCPKNIFQQSSVHSLFCSNLMKIRKMCEKSRFRFQHLTRFLVNATICRLLTFSHCFPFFANNLINLLSKKITTQFCYTKQLGRLDKIEAIPASPGQALLLLLLLIIFFYLSLQRKREGECSILVLPCYDIADI